MVVQYMVVQIMVVHYMVSTVTAYSMCCQAHSSAAVSVARTVSYLQWRDACQIQLEADSAAASSSFRWLNIIILRDGEH